MPVKINVGVAKKVGQPNFGSAGANCNVEFEIDGGYDNGSTEKFQNAVRRAYAACREAVESELTEQEEESKPQLEGSKQSRTTNRTATQSNPVTQTRGATASQVRAIYAISNHNGISLEAVLSEFNVSRPDDLSVRDASNVIDQLKSLSGSPVVAQ